MSQFGTDKIEEPLKNLERLYTLLGMTTGEIERRLMQDRKAQIELWAYLIMHNMGMRLKEKRQMILSLDAQNGRDLYQKNRTLYYKERVLVFVKRLGLLK